VRDVGGVLWHVRNGEIINVGNKSQGWARIIIDLPAPYSSNVDEVQEVMLATAHALANEPDYKRKVLEPPEVWGIESISAEALVIRLVMKVRTADQFDLARLLRLRLKLALDQLGVAVPSLNRIVMDGIDARDAIRGSRRPVTPPEDSDL
jgi:small-conductance mechanosensitive channel